MLSSYNKQVSKPIGHVNENMWLYTVVTGQNPRILCYILTKFLMYFTEPVSYILHFVTIHKNVPWNKMRKNNCFHWLHIKTLCFVTSISTVFLFFLIAKISKFKLVYVETNLVPIFSQKDLFIWCFTAQNVMLYCTKWFLHINSEDCSESIQY